VVGWSGIGDGQLTFSGGSSLAFLFDGTNMVDLNSLISPDSNWILYNATGINDAGQITGNGIVNGEYRAFLLTSLSTNAVPDSPAWITMIAGFGMIGGLARLKPFSGASSNR